MRVYLDNCCYNRPFDPQTGLRICLETMAKMRVQTMMRSDEWDYTKWQQTLFQGESIEGLAADARATAARIRRKRAKALSATR